MALAWLGLISAAAPRHAANKLFEENFESGLATTWRPVDFEGVTRYTVVPDNNGQALKATANHTASGLAVQINEAADGKITLSWRWKIDRIPPGGTESTKATFDHTARLFVAFKSFVGPPYTVNYVWANELKSGDTFHHPSSGRARFIVLQEGNSKAGQWIEEKRDLLADWKKLFGDEPPRIVGLGLMTDSDGTRSRVTGFYDDILLAKE